MGFDYLRPPIGETLYNKQGLITEVWNKFFTEIVGIEQFKHLEGIIANHVYVGYDISSTDYVAATTGWRIATDGGVGVAEFNIPIVSYANVSGTKPPANADSTATSIEGGLTTTGTLAVVQGGTVAAGITGNTAGDTAVRLWAGSLFADRATAPFRVTQAGALTATNAVIYGKLELQNDANVTGAGGTGGGALSTSIRFWAGAAYIDRDTAPFRVDHSGNTWVAGKLEVTNASGTTGAGISGGGSSSTDVRFWSGDTYANRASAAFRVTHAGALIATNATITGTMTIGAGSSYTGNTIASSYTAADVTASVISSGLLTSGRIELQDASSVTRAGIRGSGGTTAVRFWAGSDYANILTAPFLVNDSGNMRIGTAMTVASPGAIYFGDTGHYLIGITNGCKMQSNSSVSSVGVGPSGADVYSLNGAVALSAGTSITVNRGIQFPASNVSSSNVNTLDDYEEGEYTPTIEDGGGSATLSTSYDRLSYTKIGRVVTVTGQLRFSAVTVGTSTFYISLPVATGTTAVNPEDVSGCTAVSIVVDQNVTLPVAGTLCARIIPGAGSKIGITRYGTTGLNYDAAAYINVNTIITVNCTYVAAT